MKPSPSTLANITNALARHRVLSVAIALMILPFVMPYEALAINILVFGLFAMGFNLLFGYMGMLSFGHGAFLGMGGYLTGISMVHFPCLGALPYLLAYWERP